MGNGELVVGGRFEAVEDTSQVRPFFARWTDTGLPWFAVQPPWGQSMAATCGTNISIPSTVATDYDFNGALTYEWTHTASGGPIVVVEGLHGTAGAGGTVGGTVTLNPPDTLTITGYTSADAGTYTVTVSNGCTPPVGGTPSIVGLVCPADFNGNCRLEVQDIFDFLGAWFALDPRADINHQNGITVQDIFDFLGDWFAGCN